MNLPNIIELPTERLTLRLITPDVLKYIFANNFEIDIKNYLGLPSNAAWDKIKRMITKGMETFNVSVLYFQLVDKISGRIIGECGFHSWNRDHNRADIFYIIYDDADKQKGYTTEAVKAALAYGFGEMKLHRVAALTASWHVASLAVMKKFGFTYEGTHRQDYLVNGVQEDSVVYSLLKPEYEKQNN